jgi:hypothetical protein
MNELIDWNANDPMWSGRIDLGKVGALGYSMGGETVAEVGRQDPRCRAVAVVSLEPFWGFNLDSAPLNIPFLTILEETVEDRISSDFHVNNPAYHLFDVSPGPAYYLRVQGTKRLSLAGLIRVVSPHIPGGVTDNRRAAEIVGRYVVSFFNKHLQIQDDGLLTGPHASYPEVEPFLSK